MAEFSSRIPGAERRGALPRLLVCLLSSFAVLAICTKSSFLYPMNDWVDTNCFFTVGRGILRGLMPYRDLYDQKGPLTYLLYAAAALVSDSSWLGVYFLEGIFFAWFLHLGGRIAETLSGYRPIYWVTVPALAVLVPVTPAFSHGGSAEELFLPFLALGLFLVLRAQRENRPLSGRESFLLGFSAAAGLWVKYTFCGLYAGLALSVLVWSLCTRKAKSLPRVILFALLGFAALSGAVVAWFALGGALPDLWQAYFMDNLTQYSQNVRGGQYAAPIPNLLNNLPWSIPGALGLFFPLFRLKKRGWEALSGILAAVFLFVFVYWNNRRYPYYALVLAVFAPLGFAALGSLIRSLAKSFRPRVLSLSAGVLSVLLVLGGPALAYAASPNTYLMSVKKEDMPQYRFAQTITAGSDTSLLNYGFLDGGFYFAAGTLPENKFFCTLNISLAEMETALRTSIREGGTEYVVTRMSCLRDNDAYELVDEASLFFEGRVWDYYLYRRAGTR